MNNDGVMKNQYYAGISYQICGIPAYVRLYIYVFCMSIGARKYILFIQLPIINYIGPKEHLRRVFTI